MVSWEGAEGDFPQGGIPFFPGPGPLLHGSGVQDGEEVISLPQGRAATQEGPRVASAAVAEAGPSISHKIALRTRMACVHSGHLLPQQASHLLKPREA
eukprot:CAMPEP_0174368506 /NCGR_PEP_ID=MMETSP0811_2-20130205/89359_1 /TAXON_ID=73025 ORGANISM="Eutreptiella gymnastica-like, Strain CCMP1594" /NCGR_SAMPLE_ID=MMETSP0811_2 /ASSEMBLY_ACC=CAM_ASM_000667 /LENGTH=97 /DNA_ID=CAMNT_0015512093 /DNA_START=238 /DNA_END=529 /DNA_ORIENTATION=+